MIENLQSEEIFNDLMPVLIDQNPEVVKKINAVIGFTLIDDCPMSWTVDLLDNPGVRQGLEDSMKCHISVKKDVFENLLKQKKVKPWLDAYKSKDIIVNGHLPTIIKLERLAHKLVK